MQHICLKKILNLVLNKNLVNFYYIIFFISLSLIFFAIYLHPPVGDDYYFTQSVLGYPNFIKYFTHMYFNWTGRSLQNILFFWVYSNNLNLIIWKFFLLPSLLFRITAAIITLRFMAGRRSLRPWVRADSCRSTCGGCHFQQQVRSASPGQYVPSSRAGGS